MKKFIFRKDDVELVLPVTPESFQVSHGINVETINIHTVGDVNIAGYGTLCTIKIECLLPANYYPFNQPEASTNPYAYIEKLSAWCDARAVLHFVITNTLNVPVLIEDIAYGEKDGTGDLYAAITLRKYRSLTAVQMTNTQNSSRTAETSSAKAATYTIKKGDTLFAICRKVYGDASLYNKLAEYNNIKNPNLIYAGNTIQTPDKSLL